MKFELKPQRILFTTLLLLLSLSGTGCTSLLENLEYNQRVHYYESRGVSAKNAERAAYEDQFFDQMSNVQ